MSLSDCERAIKQQCLLSIWARQQEAYSERGVSRASLVSWQYLEYTYRHEGMKGHFVNVDFQLSLKRSAAVNSEALGGHAKF